MKNLLIVALLAVSCFSCVEPYDVRSINFERAVVVEGSFTNEPEINYVKLSYTRQIDETKPSPLSGATVWVESSDGERIEFIETTAGHYKSEAGVAGEAGKSYQLFFTTSDGRHYQSSVQELIASPPIESIYHKYAEKPSSTSAEIKKGIQFFADTHDETNRAKYYKYEWEETYEVQSPYPSLYEFFSDPDTAIFREELVNICYASGKSTSIILGSTATFTENRLSEMPVRYITNETDHLRYAYSILLRQYVISSEAYGFYREFLENNKDNESLFDKQLGIVVGNITSVENSEETVLGFFEVSGVSEKRIFVKFEELDPHFPWPDQSYPCAPIQIVVIDTPDSLGFYVLKGYEIHIASYRPNNSFRADLAPKYCTDCRFRGPTTKPEFWIY